MERGFTAYDKGEWKLQNLGLFSILWAKITMAIHN